MDEECAFYMIDPKQLVSTKTETLECKKPFSFAIDSWHYGFAAIGIYVASGVIFW